MLSGSSMQSGRRIHSLAPVVTGNFLFLAGCQTKGFIFWLAVLSSCVQSLATWASPQASLQHSGWLCQRCKKTQSIIKIEIAILYKIVTRVNIVHQILWIRNQFSPLKDGDEYQDRGGHPEFVPGSQAAFPIKDQRLHSEAYRPSGVGQNYLARFL